MNTQTSWSINTAKLFQSQKISHGLYTTNSSHPWRCVDEKMCLVTTFYAEVTEVVLQNTTAPNSFSNYVIARCNITMLSCIFENGGKQQLTVFIMKYASAYASEHVFLRPYGV